VISEGGQTEQFHKIETAETFSYIREIPLEQNKHGRLHKKAAHFTRKMCISIPTYNQTLILGGLKVTYEKQTIKPLKDNL